MAVLTPLWLQAGDYTATDDRELIDALFPSEGIIGSTSFAVSQRAAGANMSVDVAAGTGIITGDDVSGQGKFLADATTTQNVVIDTAPGTGNSRKDIIIARIRDADAIGGSDNDWIADVVKGTATTGTPSAPAVPASCLLLATVLVGANVSSIVDSNITDDRVIATAAGTLRPVSVSGTTSTPILDGQSVIVTSGATPLVAPEPLDGAHFRVTNAGGAAVNITPFSSETFTAPGLSAASSCPLKAVGMIEFIAVGGKWYHVAGQACSGWQTPTLTNSTQGTPNYQWRQIGNRVVFRGQLVVSDSSATLMTFPSGSRPTVAFESPVNIVGGSQTALLISTAGVMQTQATGTMLMDNIGFYVD